MSASFEQSKGWKFFQNPDGSWDIFVPKECESKEKLVQEGRFLTLCLGARNSPNYREIKAKIHLV